MLKRVDFRVAINQFLGKVGYFGIAPGNFLI